MNNSLIDRFGTIGNVSGHAVSFAPNFRITDVSFPPAFNQDPFEVNHGGGRYMGDYDMATADNHYFYTSWGDNRLSDAFFANQPDVRFAKIPVGELDDSALTTTSSILVAGALTLSAASTRSANRVALAPGAPAASSLSSPEMSIFDPIPTVNALASSLPKAYVGLPNSAGSLSIDSQTSIVSKSSDDLPSGSVAGDNQQLQSSPLVRHSVYPHASGFVSDFTGNLMSSW